nr:MAG TPA: hypothetical protein [Caudoviricetes sp.]
MLSGLSSVIFKFSWIIFLTFFKSALIILRERG